MIHRFIWTVTLAGWVAGCGSQWIRVGTGDAGVAPEESLAKVFVPQVAYRRMGRLAAPEPVPFIGHVVLADGPADSVIAVVGLSLENRALTFQQEEESFVARYRVEMRLQQEGDPPIRLTREEVVRVLTFQETLRDDEGVLFQQQFHVTPGRYEVTVGVNDLASGSSSQAEGTYLVPLFAPGTTSDPMIAYRVTGRDSPRQPLSILLNPRGTMAFGTDTLLVYIEGYGFLEPTRVPFAIRDEFNRAVYEDTLLFEGVHPVEGHVVRLPPDNQSLGQITLTVGKGGNARATTGLVSFSDDWVLNNFAETMGLLRYFSENEWLDSLRRTPHEKRAEAWHNFRVDTDPNRATTENEALDLYFARLQTANGMFNDENMPGWRTDRGEVFIILGPPDQELDRRTHAEGRWIYWSYEQYRLDLVFENLAKFGRYRLAPDSRALFMRVLARLDRQADG